MRARLRTESQRSARASHGPGCARRESAAPWCRSVLQLGAGRLVESHDVGRRLLNRSAGHGDDRPAMPLAELSGKGDLAGDRRLVDIGLAMSGGVQAEDAVFAEL